MAEVLSSESHVTEALNAAVRRTRATERSLASVPIAVGPGGKMVDATPAIRNLHAAEQHAAIYALVDQYPERYIKDHKPGWRYLWVDTKDVIALGRIRSQSYEEVLLSELIEDSDLPFTEGPLVKRLNPTHKGANQGVFLYDLQLCRCSPETYQRLYKIREDMGLARIASGFDKMRSNIEGSGFEGIETDMTAERVS